jgi:predicted nucleic acid-binding protein
VVDLIDNLRIEPANSQDVVSAIGLHRQTGFQYFDCLVLATAARIGIKTLSSEDMQHMRQIGSVTIVNPFLLTAAELDRFLS